MSEKPYHHNVKNIINQRFGLLVVVEKSDIKTTNRQVKWICQCDCGNKHIARSSNLLRGKIRSCGCVSAKMRNETKGFIGISKTREYGIWAGMKNRCKNEKDKNFKNYGARGISYDPKWETFECFWDDMKDGYKDNLEIDRINNNGNYCKENCRWSTRIEQANNKRNNRFLDINGKIKTISEWSIIYGVKYSIVMDRIYSGWSEIDSLTVKVKRVDI